MKPLSKLTWEERNEIITGYRYYGPEFVNRLYFFSDENIAHAIKRKTQDFKESGIFLVYSLIQPTGSGKSNSTLHTALTLSKLNGYHFNLDKDIVFTGTKFLERLERLDANKPGNVIIWDEGGIGGGFSRAWLTKLNWNLQEAVRMTRFFLPNIFIIVPLLELIDVNIRRLVNMELESEFVNQYLRKSYGKFKTIQRAPDEYGRLRYHERLPILISDIEEEDTKNKFIYVKKTTFDFVDEDVWKNYEELKENAYEEIKKERQGEKIQNDEVEQLKKELGRERMLHGADKGNITKLKDKIKRLEQQSHS